jgi:hypothetical protein
VVKPYFGSRIPCFTPKTGSVEAPASSLLGDRQFHHKLSAFGWDSPQQWFQVARLTSMVT